ncbi:MAG TPA: TatD family hydrolase [Chitinophagaceae bacterium]|nr:MAG: TatD family hydrolase [Bacteroidetes bacterium OLB11]HMN33124.1 TatD family hydrolase [Chitinophagaceae bacterium]
MTFIDTHTHLYDEQFDQDRNSIIEKAIDHHIQKMYMPNCDSNTIEGMLSLEMQFPNHCVPMMGLHPCYVKEGYKSELKIIEDWLAKRFFVAVGEIGLDYYWDTSFKKEQIECFRFQIELALHYHRPIVIHMRESTNDTIHIVKEYSSKGLRAIFHCFSGSYETAKQIVDMGHYLGIGGVLTFKKAGLANVLSNIDLKHLILETDSPYLAPTPYRGKRNESSYLIAVAQKLAEVKMVTLEEIADVTTKNAELIFA